MVFIVSLLGLLAFACIPVSLILAVICKLRKKPAKKALYLTAISIVIFLVAVYTVPDTSDESDGTGAQDSVVMDADDTASEDTSSDIAHDTNISYIGDIGENLRLHDSTDFSENRAWVEFREADRSNWGIAFSGNNRAALIDTTGKTLWESELTESDLVLTQKSDFQNGVAYITFSGNEQNLYYIIDSDGNVTFTKEATDDFIILASGDGSFLVAEHISNFDTDEWQLWTMDKNGQMISTPQSYDKTPVTLATADGQELDHNFITIDKELYRCKYLGENIYQLWPNEGWESVVLNMESQQTICSDFYNGTTYTEVPYFLTDFENGIAYVMVNSVDGAMICELHTDGTITPVSPNTFILSPNTYFSEGLAFVEYEGSNGVFCNLQGEIVIDFPQYNDGKHIYTCGPFQNGYAAMKVMGADGLMYITAVNKNGEIMFDPIFGFDDVLVSPDGKYVTGITFGQSITVFTIDGTPKVTVQGDIHETYDQSLDQYTSDNPDMQTYRVCNGLLYISDFYVNVEDGSVIGLPKTDYYDDDVCTVTLH